MEGTIMEDQIIKKVEEIKDKESQLSILENKLTLNPEFKQFIELKKSVDETAKKVWKEVEEEMIANNIKSIKGDFGSLTIAERQGWTYDEKQVPSKFFKKVVDTKKITDTYRLEGKAPKGCEPYTSKYLTKRLK